MGRASERCRWLLALGCAAAAIGAHGSPAGARITDCGLPSQGPLWIDYGDSTVPFASTLFARPGEIVATSGPGQAATLRSAGAASVFFDLHLNDRLGTPTAPVDPATVATKADRLFDYAVKSTGCATPLIAENELFGAGTTTPWSPSNAQYRANVLAFLQRLAARGARPFLLLSTPPYTGGDAAGWWQQVAQVSDIVQEFFVNAAGTAAEGPLLGSRGLRVAMRQAMANFTDLGIPTSRLGLMLEFESGLGQGGRNGLQPTSAWLEVVKLEALAARQVAGELGLASIWSWGWATFTSTDADPDKPVAACVYLWARSQSLCNGPAAAGAGFDASLTEGQLLLPTGAQCVIGTTQLTDTAIARLATVTGDPDAAESAVLEEAVLAPSTPLDPHLIDAAEQAIIVERFRGRRPLFLAALARARADEPLAREVIVDEILRSRREGTLSVPSPAATAIPLFAESFAAVRVRLVQTDRPVWWLGNATRGFAIEHAAPDRVFPLTAGRWWNVVTVDGTVRVRPLAPPQPLASVGPGLLAASITTALHRFAQDDAYQSWLTSRDDTALNQAICRGDTLPIPASVDLTSFLPFLAL
jgi:hypothetical protein